MQENVYAKLKHGLELEGPGKFPYGINVETGKIVSYRRYIHGKTIEKLNKKTGYLYVDLVIDGIRSRFYVHDVIMTKAGYNLTDRKVVHMDGNKLNNSIHNLKLR